MRGGPARRAAALGAALAFAAGVAATYRVFVTTAHGQLVDEATRDGGATGGHVVVLATAQGVLEIVSGATLGLAAVLVVAIALVQRRHRQALGAVAVLAGSTATTQLLKHVLLDRPTFATGSWMSANSLPSGHTTFAASVSAALLIAVPAAARPVTAVAGAAWTALTGVATLALHWHRASDVVAAVLVVGAWTALASVFVRPGPRPPGRRWRGRAARSAALVVLGLGGATGALVAAPALVAVWLATPPGLAGAFGLHVAFIGGAFGAAGLTCVVMAVQLLLLTGRPVGPGAHSEPTSARARVPSPPGR